MPAKTDSKSKNSSEKRHDNAFLRKHGDQLSSSTQRAKWIDSPDESPDRKGQSLATRSHDVIKHWADERGASPAIVPNTRVLRMDFPGYGGKNLEHVGWEDWFKQFDDRNVVFLYQEQLKNGNQSNFFRLDSPKREDG